MRMSSNLIPTLLLGATFVAAGVGCTTRTQVFEGYGDDQLWTAMVASAKSPSYDDWKVMDNQVFADESTRRIEVYRVLKRTLVTPHSPARPEEREWKFQIALGHDPEMGAPDVRFTARQFAVAAHVWTEADRYFLQMRGMLDLPRTIDATAGEAAKPAGEPAVKPVDTTTTSEPAAADAPETLPE